MITSAIRDRRASPQFQELEESVRKATIVVHYGIRFVVYDG
jgi:hypothetical protein